MSVNAALFSGYVWICQLFFNFFQKLSKVNITVLKTLT